MVAISVLSPLHPDFNISINWTGGFELLLLLLVSTPILQIYSLGTPELTLPEDDKILSILLWILISLSNSPLDSSNVW